MNSYALLVLALLPLVAGPYLARWAERSQAAKSAMDSLVAVTLIGLVVLHIWPDSYHAAGLSALGVGLAGFLLPFLLHGQLHKYEKRAFPGLIWLTFLGLALHAFLDGVALFSPQAHHHEGLSLLAVAVVLHRLPVALGIWWLVLPRLGGRSAVALLVIVGVATVLGFALANRFLAHLTSPGLALFAAGVAGMLLHIVSGHEHRHARPSSSGTALLTSALGAVLGAVLLLAIGHESFPLLPFLLALVIWASRARRLRQLSAST